MTGAFTIGLKVNNFSKPFDQNGSATTPDLPQPTYAKVGQTDYHFEFGPNTESWIERIYQIS